MVNNADSTIVGLYASNTGGNAWYYNMLDGRPIKPGGSLGVDIDDGTGSCKYDFLAKLANGRETTLFGVNACEMDTFTVNN